MITHSAEQGTILEKSLLQEKLFEWANSIGIKLNPKIIYPVLFPPGYMGMQTLSEIVPGEEILSAPNSSMFSMKLINPPILAPVYASNTDLFSIPDKSHEDSRMITYFLYEQSKGPSSFWHVYLEFLPKDVETIIDWSDSDLAELQDTDFEYDSKFRRDRDIAGNTALLRTLQNFPELFKDEYLTLENINWIWKILCTRSYGRCIPYNALIPIADLFNHKNCNTNYFYASDSEPCPDFSNEALETTVEDSDDPLNENLKPLLVSSLKLYKLSVGYKEYENVQDQEKIKEIVNQARKEDSQSFVKKINTATKNASYGAPDENEEHKFRICCSKFERFEAGAQVYIQYGRYSNRQLLSNYGFVMKENQYNYARIKVPLREFLSEEQLQNIGKGYSADLPVVFKLKATEICMELLKTIRSMLWDISSNPCIAFFNPSDLALELKSLRKMDELLEKIEKNFPTDIGQDHEILKNASGKIYSAVVYRIGQKEIVMKQRRLIKVLIEIIQRLAKGEEKYTANRICEFEIESGNHKLEVEINRQALGNYLELLLEFSL